MLHESRLPTTFWGEALGSLVHVWNRCPTDAVDDATPFELWHGHKPDVFHLRVWGCPAYVHVQKNKRSAFGSHLEKCVFIGYPDGYKAWKFYNVETKRIVSFQRVQISMSVSLATFTRHLIFCLPPLHLCRLPMSLRFWLMGWILKSLMCMFLGGS